MLFDPTTLSGILESPTVGRLKNHDAASILPIMILQYCLTLENVSQLGFYLQCDVYKVLSSHDSGAVVSYRNELILILVTFSCRLENAKTLINYLSVPPALTFIGRKRAL